MANAGTAEFEVSLEPKVRAVPDGQGRWISVQRYSSAVHEWESSTGSNGECERCGGQEWITDSEGRLHLRYTQAPSPFITTTAALTQIKALVAPLLDTDGMVSARRVSLIVQEAGL